MALSDIFNQTAAGLGNQYAQQNLALGQIGQALQDPNANPQQLMSALASIPGGQEYAKQLFGYQYNPIQQLIRQQLGNGGMGNADNAAPISNIGGITNPATTPQDNSGPSQNAPLSPNPAMNQTPIPPGGPNPSVQYQTQMPQSALAQMPSPQAQPGQNAIQAQAPALSSLDQAIAAAAQNADNQDRLHMVTQGIVGNPTSAKTQLDVLLKQKQAQQDLQTNAAKIQQEATLKPVPISEAGLISSQQNAIPDLDDIRNLIINKDGTINKGILQAARPGIGVPFSEKSVGIPAVTTEAQELQAKMFAVASAIVKSDGTRLSEEQKAAFIQNSMPGPFDDAAGVARKLNDVKKVLSTSVKLAGKPVADTGTITAPSPAFSQAELIAEAKRRKLGGY